MHLPDVTDVGGGFVPLWQAVPFVRNIVLTMDHWYGTLFSTIGNIPDKYLVIDLETTGFASFDYVTQFGYLLAEDGQIVENAAQYIRVTDDPNCNPDWLAARLETTRQACESKGAQYHTTMADIERGQSPQAVWSTVWDLLDSALSSGYLTLGYNGLRFDVPRVLAAFTRYLGPHNFDWAPDEFFDVGAMVKGVQLGDDGLPREHETLHDWALRVIHTSCPGLRWGLSSYAIDAYGLVERYALNMSKAHTADFDCLLVYYLFETFKTWAAQL